MLTKLRDTGNEWVCAVRDKKLRKMHELVNLWATLNCTPTEFTRADALGKKTVTCSIKDVADAELLRKLEKVLCQSGINSCITLALFVGTQSLAMVGGHQR